MEKGVGYIIEECRHCGNKTKLDIVARYNERFDEDFCCSEDWIILKCCACKKILFAKIYSGEDTAQYTEDGIEYEEIFDTLYPIITYQNTNVPQKVNKAFLSAIKAQHVDDVVCLIALRRTLEIICKDKKAKGETLKDKILNLTQNGTFPAIINEASDILRILGNEAAHGENFENDWFVAKEMINFTQIIIEYVYVIPYRIEQIKNTINSQNIKITHK